MVSSPQIKRQRRWLRPLLLVIGAVALVAWFTRPLWYGVAVTTTQPSRGPMVETLVTTGSVHVVARHAIATTVAGRVTEVLVARGDVVALDQPLVRVDDTDARFAVARAEATLAGISAARADLGDRRLPATREALRQARASLAQAQRDHARDTALVESAALTRDELERSSLALTLAQSRLRAASAEANAATDDGTASLSIDAQEADGRAALAAAEARLAHYLIRAPAAGVVLERSVELGDLAQPGAPLLTVASGAFDTLRIEPDEKNLKLLALGQAAVASADAFPDASFEAVVAWIAPAVDARRGTIEVHLKAPNPPAHLRPDMTVSVEIRLSRQADALTLPRTLVRDLATPTPWVLVVEGDRAVRRELKTGLSDASHVEITGGLEPTSAVIVPAPTLPSEGALVRVKPQSER